MRPGFFSHVERTIEKLNSQGENKMLISTHTIRQIAAASLQRSVFAAAGLFILVTSIPPASAAPGPLDYRVLATSRTSTMEKELNDAAVSGYRFNQLMGGRTANGGQEVVISMVRD